MLHRTQLLGVVAASTLLLAGCAGTSSTFHPIHNTSSSASSSSAASPSSSASNDMGMTAAEMANMNASAGPRPSASAKMVCSDEIRDSVTSLLKLSSRPEPVDHWANNHYTCTYHLPAGSLVLSVQDSPDVATGRAYFTKLRHGLRHTRPLGALQSLGLPAFETADGSVAFLKDGKTLQVDATGLPARVGPHHSPRINLAYTLATDVIACWSE
jgi:hypothetical protein